MSDAKNDESVVPIEPVIAESEADLDAALDELQQGFDELD
jgi:hypothetical protein